jgi:hypothetical protein
MVNQVAHRLWEIAHYHIINEGEKTIYLERWADGYGEITGKSAKTWSLEGGPKSDGLSRLLSIPLESCGTCGDRPFAQRRAFVTPPPAH